MLNPLEEAEQNLQEFKSHDYPAPMQNLGSCVEQLINMNAYDTIWISYKPKKNTVLVSYRANNKTFKIYFKGYTPELYNRYCDTINLGPTNNEYNAAQTYITDTGIQVRQFAYVPPTVVTPEIVISTTKPVPTNVELPLSSDLWNTIVHSNFLIGGSSGAGKTYLMNYLISTYIGENEHIAFMEEFEELTEPNELTLTVHLPPVKPGKKSLLEFATQESNLMRQDKVVVGEIKGEEAWPFVKNLSSGTSSCATIHATSVNDALTRLQTMSTLGNMDFDRVGKCIATGIQYVIIIQNHIIKTISKINIVYTNGIYSTSELYPNDDGIRIPVDNIY